jgi:hypothetical protein
MKLAAGPTPDFRRRQAGHLGQVVNPNAIPKGLAHRDCQPVLRPQILDRGSDCPIRKLSQNLPMILCESLHDVLLLGYAHTVSVF